MNCFDSYPETIVTKDKMPVSNSIGFNRYLLCAYYVSLVWYMDPRISRGYFNTDEEDREKSGHHCAHLENLEVVGSFSNLQKPLKSVF